MHLPHLQQETGGGGVRFAISHSYKFSRQQGPIPPQRAQSATNTEAKNGENSPHLSIPATTL